MEPYEGREPYIFISYARKDKEQVLPYLDALSGAGYRVWYDKGIHAGDDWLKTLLEKVRDCAVFCPLFSEAFKDSRYCLFETAWAYQKTDKTIVSLYLDNLDKDNLGRLYRHLRKFQELPLYNLTPAQFAEQMEREPAFKDCKAPRNEPPEGWQKIGEIQWRLSADGVLSIAKNEGWRKSLDFGSIPSYQRDPIHGGSAAPWMLYREKIVSLEIADDINEIGDLVFYDYKSLTDVRIPNSVTKIGDWAFTGCKNLTDVRIPNSVTVIGGNAFFACYSLTNVRIGDGVTVIGDCAFGSCVRLTDVRIPDSVTVIGDRAFSVCESLTDVHIGDGVTKIGDRAFESCESLTNVHIGDGVTKIGTEAFQNCVSLTDVRIPDSVTEIGAWAFEGCKNLKSVEIPAGAKVDKYDFPKHTRVTRRTPPRPSLLDAILRKR